jgi:uncharacterized membrane protein
MFGGAIAALVGSGGCNLVTLDEYPCPSGGTTLTYANFGRQFMAEWCNGCHSAPDGQRNGAPDDVTFTTQADVLAHKDRIFARAADTNDSMPTGPDMIPAEQRVDLANWLACGAH